MKKDAPAAVVTRWLAEPLSKDVVQSIDRVASLPDVRRVALMPDVHLAADVCVGLVVATTRTIYPRAVGSDIGCGMLAMRFEAPADLLADELSAGRLLAALYRYVPSLKQPREAIPAALPEQLLHAPLSHRRLEKLKRRDALLQWGTLGRGNHFVEFQSDHEAQLWLMLHSGSRGMGQAIAAHHEERARTSLGNGFDVESDAGQAYLLDHDWAIEYAMQNRLAMLQAVCEVMEELFGVTATPDSLIHCHHNHVRCETHFGESHWVHRKGALAAPADQPGVIPGSMGARSYHVRGRGHADSLASSSHGAGRALSRGAAAASIPPRALMRQMRGVWFDQRRAAALCDEAPAAYKDIGAVMRAQRELIRIDRELRPLLSYKG
jgi:tRNA-splicing ligase RtcB